MQGARTFVLHCYKNLEQVAYTAYIIFTLNGNRSQGDEHSIMNGLIQTIYVSQLGSRLVMTNPERITCVFILSPRQIILLLFNLFDSSGSSSLLLLFPS